LDSGLAESLAIVETESFKGPPGELGELWVGDLGREREGWGRLLGSPPLRLKLLGSPLLSSSQSRLALLSNYFKPGTLQLALKTSNFCCLLSRLRSSLKTRVAGFALSSITHFSLEFGMRLDESLLLLALRQSNYCSRMISARDQTK
jgi:hypothetical protein